VKREYSLSKTVVLTVLGSLIAAGMGALLLPQVLRSAGIGCSPSSDGHGDMICPDGTAYVIPVLLLWALILCLAAVIIMIPWTMSIDQDRRARIALRLERVQGLVMGVGGMVALFVSTRGSYGLPTLWTASLVILLGFAAVMLPSGAIAWRICVMTAITILLLLLLAPMFLLSPVLLVAAGAALTALGLRLPMGRTGAQATAQMRPQS
jgi:hypothetical protein